MPVAISARLFREWSGAVAGRGGGPATEYKYSPEPSRLLGREAVATQRAGGDARNIGCDYRADQRHPGRDAVSPHRLVREVPGPPHPLGAVFAAQRPAGRPIAE